MKWFFGIALALTVANSSHAGDLMKAKLLYDSQLPVDAKRELVEVITSNASPSDKAAALHLLGTIAVDEKRYDSAIRTWNDLIARYPNTVDAREAKGKLPLVQALHEQPTPQATYRDSSITGIGGVVIAGIGTETEFVSQTVTEFMNLLASRGVAVSRAPVGVTSVPELLKQTPVNQAKGVLVLALRFGYMENLRAMCYGSDGRLMWEEKSSGSMGITKSGVTQGLIERVSKKIEPHIGGTCLPNN